MCGDPIKCVMYVFFGMFLSHTGGKLQRFGWHKMNKQKHENIMKIELFLLFRGLILLL